MRRGDVFRAGRRYAICDGRGVLRYCRLRYDERAGTLTPYGAGARVLGADLRRLVRLGNHAL